MQVQQLFVKHQGALKRYILSLVPDFADADDVLQRVFLTVSDKADDYELEPTSWHGPAQFHATRS